MYCKAALLLCGIVLPVLADTECPKSCIDTLKQKVYTDNATNCHLIPVSCLEISNLANKYSDCHYGMNLTFQFSYVPECKHYIPADCKGQKTRESQCKYCFQMKESQYTCANENADCNPKSSGRDRQITVSCEVNPEVICKGGRIFKRKIACSFTTGKSWSTALILSVTLGGFGADRFYLGYWREGLGKLFSFGGLGVWTIVDIVLITVGYVGPADRSLYIYS